MRLDKLLAEGLGLSRADAKRLLASGAVTVEGTPVRSAAEKADPEAQRVCANGRRVELRGNVFLMMNKPLGVVSATRDAAARTALDLVPEPLRRKGLFPAGRLDKYSEGMLLLTDDGDFAHRLLSPRSRLPKVYEVWLDAPVADAALAEVFRAGAYLGGGESASPAILEPIAPDHARVTIFEGIYHEVRRMFDQNGAHVTRLVRVQIGGLPLDPALAPGQVRELTQEELRLLLTEEGGDANACGDERL